MYIALLSDRGTPWGVVGSMKLGRDHASLYGEDVSYRCIFYKTKVFLYFVNSAHLYIVIYLLETN